MIWTKDAFFKFLTVTSILAVDCMFVNFYGWILDMHFCFITTFVSLPCLLGGWTVVVAAAVKHENLVTILLV